MLAVTSKRTMLRIFKPTVENESLHAISNGNCVRVIYFATSENLIFKSTIFLHSTNGETHTQINHILVAIRRQLSVLDVMSFRAADCDTDHYLVVAEDKETIAVNKQRSRRFHMESSNLSNLKDLECKEKYRVEVSNRFAPLRELNSEVKMNSTWEKIIRNIKISAKESLGYCELKDHKSWFDRGS
jgi:hypothetical protein